MLRRAENLYIFLALAGIQIIDSFTVSAFAGKPGSAWAFSQQRLYFRLKPTGAFCGNLAALPLRSERIKLCKSSVISTRLSADQKQGDTSSQQGSIVDQVASKGMKIMMGFSFGGEQAMVKDFLALN